MAEIRPWLTTLIKTDFNNAIRSTHNENCSLFCILCCRACRPTHNTSHTLLQVFRNNYQSAIRVAEISEHFNIAGIQQHIIQHHPLQRHTVVLIRTKISDDKRGRDDVRCKSCGKFVPDEFCSIECKVNILRDSAATQETGGGASAFTLVSSSEGNEVASASNVVSSTEENCVLLTAAPMSPLPEPSGSFRRNRKGTPRRSPLK